MVKVVVDEASSTATRVCRICPAVPRAATKRLMRVGDAAGLASSDDAPDLYARADNWQIWTLDCAKNLAPGRPNLIAFGPRRYVTAATISGTSAATAVRNRAAAQSGCQTFEE